jgi:hypothetical protein
MKKFMSLIMFFALFLTACATNKIDWQSRVGNFTYDQAVLEFGPPDKEATLQDGTRVAEWLTSRGRGRPGADSVVSRVFTTHSPMPEFSRSRVVALSPALGYSIRDLPIPLAALM